MEIDEKVNTVFSSLYGRELDEAECLEIEKNLVGFFSLLVKAEGRISNEGKRDPIRANQA